MKPFFVYMLGCSDGSYYVGSTDNLPVRMQQHTDSKIGYTSVRRPLSLLWSGEFESRIEALNFEQQIKGWSRAKKQALIAGDWKTIQQHAWGKNNPLPEHLRASIPQPERGEGEPERALGEPERAMADSEWGGSEPKRGGGEPEPSPSVRPEVSKGMPGRLEGRASIPQPERGMGEPERGMGEPERGMGEPERGMGEPEREMGEPEREMGEPKPPPPVLPELSKGVCGARDLDGLLVGNRRAIAKAITLLESTRADHRQQADALLTELLPHTSKSFRLGLSGVPGVGKSTFIEALGLYLIAQGHRVAVLAIDPSSSVSGGSILGDKTRMEQLSVQPQAYIRPSPARGNLGGVAEHTREAMLVLEAAGYDVVIVETVGVGQSEVAVQGMTDLFVLMQLPNAGDDLQAIKKGVMELADMVLINKADIDPDAATRAQAQITSAMRIFGMHGKAASAHWQPRVMPLSALKGRGVASFWSEVKTYQTQAASNGWITSRRQAQAVKWMHEAIAQHLRQNFENNPRVIAQFDAVTARVLAGELAAGSAARFLVDLARASP